MRGYFQKHKIVKGFLSFFAIMALIFLPFSQGVFAGGGVEIEITSITQNGVDLEIQSNGDSKYAVTSDYVHDVDVEFTAKNAIVGRTYSVQFGNGDSTYWLVENTDDKVFSHSFPVDYYSGEFLVGLSLAATDDDAWAWAYCDIRVENDSFFPISSFEILGVEQNGSEVTPELNESNEYEYHVNDFEDIIVHLRANQSMDAYEYTFILDERHGYDTTTLSGLDLKNGFDLILPSYENTEPRALYVEYETPANDGSFGSISAKYNDKPAGVYYEHDTSIGRFSSELVYINNPDVKVGQNVSIAYHNDGNPLGVKIHGNYYSGNKDYDVKITLRKEASGTYNAVKTYNTTVSGAELNSGKVIELEDFVMGFYTKDEMVYDACTYEVVVEVDHTERTFGADYGYGSFNSTILYENGMQNAPGQGFGGACDGYRFCSKGYSAHKSVMNDAYIYYSAQDYDESKTFKYELYYTNTTPYYGFVFENSDLLKTGTITGKELNAGVLGVKLSNPNNYSIPAYTLIITDENEYVMATVIDTLNLWDGTGIVSQEVTSEHDIYLGMFSFNYLVSKGEKVEIRLKGTGFDNSKKYEVTATGYDSSSSNEWVAKTKKKNKVSGSDLNNGSVKIEIDYINIDDMFFDITVKDEGSDDEYQYSGSMVMIKYVDLNDVLSAGYYSLNNAKAALRGVSKRTSVTKFLNSVNAKNNGEVKIFDKSGKNEVNGTVGTGMIARIFDEFGRPTNDIGIAVKGDISGDGDNTVLDLVKMSRHVADIESLSGIYEIAGDVTNTGSVTLLDLVKTARDVAGVEEL